VHASEQPSDAHRDGDSNIGLVSEALRITSLKGIAALRANFMRSWPLKVLGWYAGGGCWKLLSAAVHNSNSIQIVVDVVKHLGLVGTTTPSAWLRLAGTGPQTREFQIECLNGMPHCPPRHLSES
jgi:hypothetical protein